MSVICKVETCDDDFGDRTVNAAAHNKHSEPLFHLKKELDEVVERPRGRVKAKEEGEEGDGLSAEIELRRVEDGEVEDLERQFVEAERVYEEIKGEYVDKLLQVQNRRKNCHFKIPIVRRIDATETSVEIPGVRRRDMDKEETARCVENVKQTDCIDVLDTCSPFATSEVPFTAVPDGDEPQLIPSLVSAVPNLWLQQQLLRVQQHQQQHPAIPQQYQQGFEYSNDHSLGSDGVSGIGGKSISSKNNYFK